jgi:hypothetical protein
MGDWGTWRLGDLELIFMFTVHYVPLPLPLIFNYHLEVTADDCCGGGDFGESVWVVMLIHQVVVAADLV